MRIEDREQLFENPATAVRAIPGTVICNNNSCSFLHSLSSSKSLRMDSISRSSSSSLPAHGGSIGAPP